MISSDEMLKNIPDSSLIVIREGKINYQAFFVDIAREGIVVIINDEGFTAFNKMYLVELSGRNNERGFKYRVSATIRVFNKSLGMYLLTVISYEKEEKRRYVRVGVVLPAQIALNGEKQEDVTIIDLSEGGLCFVATTNQLKGCGRILFEYNSNPYTCNVKILNVHPTNGFNKYMYHCQFEHLVANEQNKIRSLVYAVQREYLKRNTRNNTTS